MRWSLELVKNAVRSSNISGQFFFFFLFFVLYSESFLLGHVVFLSFCFRSRCCSANRPSTNNPEGSPNYSVPRRLMCLSRPGSRTWHPSRSLVKRRWTLASRLTRGDWAWSPMSSCTAGRLSGGEPLKISCMCRQNKNGRVVGSLDLTCASQRARKESNASSTTACFFFFCTERFRPVYFYERQERARLFSKLRAGIETCTGGLLGWRKKKNRRGLFCFPGNSPTLICSR